MSISLVSGALKNNIILELDMSRGPSIAAMLEEALAATVCEGILTRWIQASQ